MTTPIDVAAAVVQRLKDHVPALATVGGALDLASVVAAKALPGKLPAAYVVSVGDDVAFERRLGATSHTVTETISVILIDRKEGDGIGGKVRASLWPLKKAVLSTVTGASPGSGYAAFAYLGSHLAGIGAPGGAAEQLQFETKWKLYTKEIS
jgi:plastocyanin